MAAETSFDYYYGDESNQFSFYRIPRQLVIGERFKRLSTDAKLLYGLLLDRMGLSAKNGWFDEQGRVYIYYTLDEIQEDLNCGHDKATKLLVELGSGKSGFGLIERVRQGQGRPTKIYVKRFTTRAVPTLPPEPSPRPRLFSGQDCGEVAAKTAEKPQSRVRGSRSQDCGKAAPNYIKSNQTDFSYTDPSMRVKTRIEQLTQEGHFTGGRAPFGYRAEKTGRMNKKNQDVRDLVIDPEDAEIVKLIFQKYVYEGYGALRLCRYFREQGIRRKDGGEVTVGMIIRTFIYLSSLG